MQRLVTSFEQAIEAAYEFKAAQIASLDREIASLDDVVRELPTLRRLRGLMDPESPMAARADRLHALIGPVHPQKPTLTVVA